MVKAAYSTGKPALGVGAGNVPSYIGISAKSIFVPAGTLRPAFSAISIAE